MKDANKGFVLSAGMFFALGVGFFLYFQFLEHQARQNLPLEMRTAEAIQKYYDGAVCLGCDISGIISISLFFVIGIIIVVLWAFYSRGKNRDRN